MRAIQNSHMDDPKFRFADIGYSLVINNADGDDRGVRGARSAGGGAFLDDPAVAVGVVEEHERVPPSAPAGHPAAVVAVSF